MRHPLAVCVALLVALSSDARACPGLGETKLIPPAGEVVFTGRDGEFGLVVATGSRSIH